MPTSPVSLIEHICRNEPSDGELLGRFVEHRDETALAVLIDRHGPMAWGVCRRSLGHHDAEDAFQATFIVLARKAASIKPREMVGNWLYGVALQAALQARTAARRRSREIQVTKMPDVEAPLDQWADVRPILDEELSRLPGHYRAVIVLCDLEGRTRKKVARQFGCPEGTVASRLSRAREMLAKRLTGRGVALSGAAVLSQSIALAVPVASSTIKAASLCAAGQAVISVRVAALTEGVLKAMFFSKLKAAIAVVLILGFVATGASLLILPVGAQEERNPIAEPSVPREKAKRGESPVPASRDLTQLMAFKGDQLVLIDPAGKLERVIQEGAQFYSDARLSPDGKQLAYLEYQKTMTPRMMLFVRTLDENATVTDLKTECKSFVWSPDGSEIACTDYESGPAENLKGFKSFVVNVKTQEKAPLKVADGHKLTDWSKDGKRLLATHFYKDGSETRARQCLLNKDDGLNQLLTDEKQYCSDGRLSPDGRWVLSLLISNQESGEHGLVLFDLTTRKSVPVEIPNRSTILGFCWSPNGRQIAYVRREVHMGTQKELESKKTMSYLVISDPDGKNARSIASEAGPDQWTVTIGRVYWQ